jgi:hypothetical protein
MKHLILLLVTLVAALSCSQSDSGLLPNGLIGTWQLISYCKPTGTSTCTPVTVPVDKGVFIRFDNTGKFDEFYENTKPVEYSFLGCFGGTYAIEGSDIRIIAGCMSSSNGRLIPLVSINNSRLTLNPFGSGEYIFIRR